MNLADLSIKRPIFVTCIVLLSLVIGLVAMSRLGVDQFPDVTLPIVVVATPYPGAGPAEIETLVSKPLEDELSTLAGIKRLSSESREGMSVMVAEFTLETDIKYAEQQVRDRVGIAKSKLPTDVKDSTIQRVDPADQPILQIALDAELGPAQLFDLADDKIRPLLEQVPSVGKVEVIGGRKREIHVSLDRNKLKAREISAGQVAARLAGAGEDVPSGKKSQGDKETVFRTVGAFGSIQDIRSIALTFFGNEVPVRVADVAQVDDALEDESTRAYINGRQSLFINAFKQSGTNTVRVSDDLKKRIETINAKISSQPGHPKLTVIRDGATVVRVNVQDVEESIFIGITLAVIVVFLFLANFRSTLITGLALPNSLLGSFLLMWIAGYTINIMTLLALTLSVGLLVDDAIVVRENIFRHLEMGKNAIRAALDGTGEVRMAVIATTLTVIAVFGPLGFLSGVVGQFFKQFGLTVVFAMLISLFDALTIAPMLSAYFAGRSHTTNSNGLYDRTVGRFLNLFVKLQDNLEIRYEKLLHWVVRRPFTTLSLSVVVFFASVGLVRVIPVTFVPAQDSGEFGIGLDMPPGTNLDAMSRVALKADAILRKNKEVIVSALTVGSASGDPNQANFYVHLVDSKKRTMNTSEFKAQVREQLKELAYANPVVKDYSAIGGNQRAFNMNINGADQKELEKIALKIRDQLRQYPGLLDVDVNFRPGKPEFQVRPDKNRALQMGVTTASIGNELRTQIEGITPAKFRENGLEYDIRVRLQEDQRDLQSGFYQTYIPNMNNSLLRLDRVAQPLAADGPSKITRQDRSRYVQISADLKPGAGLGNIMQDIDKMMSGDLKLPEGYEYKFIGQAENFKELGQSMAIAMGAGILFIFLVLASLYESFVTPFTIMLAMPLAICGSFIALAITQESLNIFSMIGLIMLLGVAVKNSILLVDYAHQLIEEGKTRSEAIILSGKTRLRPILMTSMALVAGTLPIAMGLNEASKQRTSMGVAIIGGLVSSTLLTLVVVPAAFSYVDRFRVWSKNFLGRLFVADFEPEGRPGKSIK